MKFQKFRKKNRSLSPQLLKKKDQSYKLKIISIQTNITKVLKKNLYSTPLYEELISLGAFVGEHYRWTHFSQNAFIKGYKNNYAFYNIEISIRSLTYAGRFLKKASEKKLEFVFVGNPTEGEEGSALIFSEIKRKFFPNNIWEPGFFSKKLESSKYVLIIYDISKNHFAFKEAVNMNIPVVGFVTCNCDIRNVDYPIILNLQDNIIWFANFSHALLIK